MNKYKSNIQFILISCFIVIYRYFWSLISQWREDQSTTIWLASTKSVLSTPVGLLSSKGIPNLNGMIIFSKIFNFVDSLLVVTLLLSLIQIFCFYILIKQLTISEKMKLSLFILLSSSTLITSSSIELWNQWVLIIFNTIFFYIYLKFLKSPELFYIFLMIIISTIPASIYLSGLINSILMGTIVVYEIFSGKYKVRTKKSITKYSAILIFFASFIYLSWFQYIKSINVSEIFSFSGLTLYDRFNLFSDKFLEVPGLLVNIWNRQSSFLILQLDRDIVSSTTFNLFKVFVEIHKVIIVFLFYALFIIFKNTYKGEDVFEKINKKFLVSSLFFVFFATLLSPILGGPDFTNYERIDSYLQYYPFFLIFWFLVILKLRDYNLKFVNKSTTYLFSIFIFINVSLSIFIITDNLNYQGDKLTEADVPLIEKIEVSRYIASDMDSKNLKEATISYQLGGGIWDWIPNHSEKFSDWYVDYPYTIGRVYDHILNREYGLRNIYEGTNSRDYEDSQYIVSYIFNSPKLENKNNYQEILFNRLRLSIKDN